MPTMGKYCKAYPLKKFREFSQWTERLENVRKDKKEVDGQALEVARELTDDEFLYLQETYKVTDGIFLDQNIIFDQVTSEWKKFCEQTLGFEIPADKTVTVKTSDAQDSIESQ